MSQKSFSRYSSFLEKFKIMFQEVWFIPIVVMPFDSGLDGCYQQNL